MAELPILFSAPMVRATLASTKSQTRRAVKHPAIATLSFIVDCGDGWWGDEEGEVQVRCPYGQPGDRLWVRETYFAWGRWETRFSAKKGRDEWHFVDMTLEAGKSYLYAANGLQPQPMGGKRHKGGVTPTWWKRPAIFMPRAACRISRELTGVRVERLQDISEADALAEGIVATRDGYGLPDGSHFHCVDPRESYWSLWEHINGAGSVEANPWVWVVEFKRVTS